MDMDSAETKRPIPLGKLAFGIALLAVGILSFTDALDLADLHHIGRFWPVLLILIGVSSEIDALRERRGGGGYIIAAVGVWFLAGREHLFGLTQRTAFPLALAVAGAGLILHAMVDRPSVKKEHRNGRN
jgi:hypothetical protein